MPLTIKLRYCCEPCKVRKNKRRFKYPEKSHTQLMSLRFFIRNLTRDLDS